MGFMIFLAVLMYLFSLIFGIVGIVEMDMSHTVITDTIETITKAEIANRFPEKFFFLI